MKESIKYKLLIIVFSIAVVFLLFINSTSFKKAQNSCKLFREFQGYIKNNNWEKSQEMLSPFDVTQEYGSLDFSSDIENRPVIENGKLISLNGDVTDYIIKAKPRLLVTYNYYRSKKRDSDKVILTNGYILFKNNKIIFIKFP